MLCLDCKLLTRLDLLNSEYDRDQKELSNYAWQTKTPLGITKQHKSEKSVINQKAVNIRIIC